MSAQAEEKQWYVLGAHLTTPEDVKIKGIPRRPLTDFVILTFIRSRHPILRMYIGYHPQTDTTFQHHRKMGRGSLSTNQSVSGSLLSYQVRFFRGDSSKPPYFDCWFNDLDHSDAQVAAKIISDVIKLNPEEGKKE